MLDWLPNTNEEMQPDDYYRAALEVTENGYLSWKYIAPKHHKTESPLTAISFELEDTVFTCRKNKKVLIKIRLNSETAEALWSVIYKSTQ
jgi:hypothetical protein